MSSPSLATVLPERPMPLQLWDDGLTLQFRLEALGLLGLRRLVLHTNRSVVVSQGRSGAIRLHRGFVYAPDRVLRAIVRFLTPGPSLLHRRAQRDLLAFPVQEFAPPERPARK